MTHLFPEDILRMTMVIHGGIADCLSSHCGGLMIGILMIGLLYGREDLTGDERLAPSIAHRFWQRFLDEHCKLSDPVHHLSEKLPRAVVASLLNLYGC